MVGRPRVAAPGLVVQGSQTVADRILRPVLALAFLAAVAMALPHAARGQDPAGADSTQANTAQPDTTQADSTRVNAAPVDSTQAEPAQPDSTVADTLVRAAVPLTPRFPNELPFAGNARPQTYPQLAVAIGYGGYFSGFAGVDQAFKAIEDTIRSQGYAVPSSPGVNPGHVAMMTLALSLNRFLDIACQVGSTTEDELRFVGGLVEGRYQTDDMGMFSLRGGVGAGSYGFDLKRSYGVPVSPVDPSGGYTRLDYIKFEGGGNYWTVAGSIAIRADAPGALEAFVQYLGMSDVTKDVGGIRMAANMSGTMMGVSFKIFFW